METEDHTTEFIWLEKTATEELQ